MRRGIGRLAVAALVLAAAGPAGAGNQPSSSDYLDGEGYIVTTASGTHTPAKAEFCVTAGCKNGSPWGHLEYIDKGTRLNVHATSITAYVFVDQLPPDRHGELRGTRQICGTAKTNHFGNVDFWVQAKDTGEPNTYDDFIIRLTKDKQLVYTTEGDADHTLGGPGSRGGGDLDLEKPNRWKRTGDFSHLRSEEHTSELQSQSNLVCRLLLEKKKNHDARADRSQQLFFSPAPSPRTSLVNTFARPHFMHLRCCILQS